MRGASPETLGADLEALRERKGALDALWGATAAAVLLGLGAPWFLRILVIDFERLAWTVFGFALLYVPASLALDRAPTARRLLAGLLALHVAGVVFLAAATYLAGGTRAPALLAMFVLPVIASGLLAVRWLAYAIAGLSFVLAAAAALAASSALRWYVAQLGLSPEPWLGGLLAAWPQGGAATSVAEPHPAASVAALILVGVVLFMAAFASETVVALLMRLYRRLYSSVHALEEAEGLSQRVFRAAPDPTVLLFEDTLRVAQASDSFRRQLLVDEDRLLSGDLFGLVSFAFPDVVEEVIVKGGGVVPLAVYRVGPETRIARVHVSRLRHRDTAYVLLSLQDITDRYRLERAFEVSTSAHLVLDGTGRLAYFNPAAAAMLGALEVGVEAEVLDGRASPTGWWILGRRSAVERRVEIGGAAHAARLARAEIPGLTEAQLVIEVRRQEAAA